MTHLKLTPTKVPIEPVDYMKFPDWLYKDGMSHKELFPDEESAKNYYVMFFTIMNINCQISLASELKNAIDVLVNGKIEQSTSLEAFETIRSTVEDVVLKTWLDKFSVLLDGLEVTEPWVKVSYNPGFGPKIQYSSTFTDMLAGKCKFDFIVNHEVTETAFTQMARKLLIIDTLNLNKSILGLCPGSFKK